MVRRTRKRQERTGAASSRPSRGRRGRRAAGPAATGGGQAACDTKDRQRRQRPLPGGSVTSDRTGFPSIAIGSRLRLAPPGAVPVDDGRIAVTIARGAFGSGEHETTAACLEALEALPELGGALVLDLGCGTGVLAIAALALGARAATAVDIEPAAVVVTRANCSLNRVSARVGVIAGTLAALRVRTCFDLVAANIPAAVLIAGAPALLALTTAGAPLVFSGILWEELFDVERRYRQLGCTTLRRRMLEEYALLIMRAPAAARAL